MVKWGAALFAVAMIVAGPLAAQNLQAGLDAYNRGDWSTALNELLPLAEQGQVKAELYVGNLFGDGHGVELNHATAVKWFKKAAEQGDPEAEYDVGLFYYFGLGGLPKDVEKAAEWYRKSAAQGNSKAATGLDLIAHQKEFENLEKEHDRLEKRDAVKHNPCKVVNFRSRNDTIGNLWIEGTTDCASGDLTIRAYEKDTNRYVGNAHARIDAYAFEAVIRGAHAEGLSIRYVIKK